jgi:hypothetical protein
MGERHTVFWLGNSNGRDCFEDLGKDDRIILECILRKWGGKVRTR